MVLKTSKTKVPSTRKKRPDPDPVQYPPITGVTPFVPTFASDRQPAPIAPSIPNVPIAVSTEQPSLPTPALTISQSEGWLNHPITQQFTQFNAASHLPGDLFSVSSSLPRTDDKTFQQSVQAIKEQVNSAKLAQENLKLSTEVLKAEGLSIKAMQQVGLNMIEVEKLAGIGVDYQTQKVQTDIKRVRLEEAQINHKYELESLQRTEQTWQLKIEGMDTEISKAQKLLQAKKAEVEAIPVVALSANPPRQLAPAA